jgi:hypothetical protein
LIESSKGRILNGRIEGGSGKLAHGRAPCLPLRGDGCLPQLAPGLDDVTRGAEGLQVRQLEAEVRARAHRLDVMHFKPAGGAALATSEAVAA